MTKLPELGVYALIRDLEDSVPLDKNLRKAQLNALP